MNKTILCAAAFILLMSFCFVLFSEESFLESEVGEVIEVEGKAVNTVMGAIVQTEYGAIYIEDLECWPDDVNGFLIKIKGIVVVKNDLPVFIPKEGEPPKSGMPVPPGTDLKEASKRYLLQDSEWIIVPVSNVDELLQ